jgi:hypothetical protein
MYGIFTYIYLKMAIWLVNVGKYTIHGASGIYIYIYDNMKSYYDCICNICTYIYICIYNSIDMHLPIYLEKYH